MFNHCLNHSFPPSLVLAVLFLLLCVPTWAAIIMPSEIKRCPSPRSLCNRAEASKTEFLDGALETYFTNKLGPAHEGDRELVWWALAGGGEGRWWWEGSNNGQGKPYNRITKRGTQLNESKEEKEQRMAKDKAAYEAKQEEERRQREMQREREERLKDESTNWRDSERGFCCGQGFTCMGLSVDNSLVYCYSEEFVNLLFKPGSSPEAWLLTVVNRTLLVLTPEKTLLDIQTLEYIYENDTTGNLRNYEVPRRAEGVHYGPTKPTPIPIPTGERLGSVANREFPCRMVSLGVLAVGVIYLL